MNGRSLSPQALVQNALTRDFFARDTVVVAKELIGTILVRKLASGETLAGRIVETEAYLQDDAACHAYPNFLRLQKGKSPEGRSALLFGPPAITYVYLNYGMYWLFNIVTEPKGVGGAVLIRAIEPLLGEAKMMELRGPKIRRRYDLTNGPGKLTLALGIGKQDNELRLAPPSLYISENTVGNKEKIGKSKRIGITKNADVHWRFFAVGNPFVSGSK